MTRAPGKLKKSSNWLKLYPGLLEVLGVDQDGNMMRGNNRFLGSNIIPKFLSKSRDATLLLFMRLKRYLANARAYRQPELKNAL
ncbi:hypothetical protein METHB2_170003 [Candidatus Methylobacter favarea]|uniref:Uncharacterized protein n=1 Tax=Candidatus Methylobacter favarea TaxID=2707345 RepID=A0A8S0WZ58_9GAMM|nr:hypothetical protein [Candidatus Methylobacter favarea]CAA9889985.1 hypothetical protein METHB2_170003 [Candidatus Methylobacter favarea]